MAWDPERGVIQGTVDAPFVTHPRELAAMTFGESGQEQTLQTIWTPPVLCGETG